MNSHSTNTLDARSVVGVNMLSGLNLRLSQDDLTPLV